MPAYPVRCPRCDADLTVGRELLNRPVECGACRRPFVPIMEPGGPEPDELPTKEKSGVGSGLGLLSFLLGLLALPSCCCGAVQIWLGLGAIVSGLIGLRMTEGRGLAITGLILGGVAAGLQVLARMFGFWPGEFGPF
jgi:hypothetical protein